MIDLMLYLLKVWLGVLMKICIFLKWKFGILVSRLWISVLIVVGFWVWVWIVGSLRMLLLVNSVVVVVGLWMLFR